MATIVALNGFEVWNKVFAVTVGMNVVADAQFLTPRRYSGSPQQQTTWLQCSYLKGLLFETNTCNFLVSTDKMAPFKATCKAQTSNMLVESGTGAWTNKSTLHSQFVFRVIFFSHSVIVTKNENMSLPGL